MGYFKLEYSVKTSVVEWDDSTFTDCRPEEAAYEETEHTEAAQVGDRSGTLTKSPTSDLQIIEGVDEASSFARNFVEVDLPATLSTHEQRAHCMCVLCGVR